MLEGKIALVTGASRGIGRQIALTLGREGASVIVNYNGSAAKAEEVVKEIEAAGGKAEAVQCNVSDFESCGRMMADVVSRYGRLDILVNNAGITRDNLLMKMSEEDFDAVISTNLKGVFNCIKHISRQMLKQKGGRIINISSTGALQGERNSSIYAATKAGIMALSRAAALELGPSGITINCVLPGFTRTNNNCHVPHTIDESFIPITPTGRVTVAQDIANACLFFAGEEAAQITAQCLPVDGGFSGTRAVQVAWNASMERK